VVVHENFYAGALYNDIALLYLEKPADFAPNVDTVCLPPLTGRFDGQTCFASGWGKNSFGKILLMPFMSQPAATVLSVLLH
jgi:kallikrein